MTAVTDHPGYRAPPIDKIKSQRSVPEFGPGDTVRVMVKVIEVIEDSKDKKKKGTAEPKVNVRLQAYEGLVIARSGGGLNESFTVRKISYGEGVERVFPIYSPYIAEIEVLSVAQGAPREAVLPACRRGKAARIFERTTPAPRRLNAAFKGFKKPKGEADDLSKIKGIDATLAGRLNGIGVIKYRPDCQLLGRRHHQRRRSAVARRSHRARQVGGAGPGARRRGRCCGSSGSLSSATSSRAFRRWRFVRPGDFFFRLPLAYFGLIHAPRGCVFACRLIDLLKATGKRQAPPDQLPQSRERRLRRLAQRLGLEIRKVGSGRERGRFHLDPLDADIPAYKRKADSPSMTLMRSRRV